MKKIIIAALALAIPSLVADSKLTDTITISNSKPDNYFVGASTSTDGKQITLLGPSIKNSQTAWTKDAHHDGKAWALYALDPDAETFYTYAPGSDTFNLSQSSKTSKKTPAGTNNVTVINNLGHSLYLVGLKSDGKAITLEVFEKIPNGKNATIPWNVGIDSFDGKFAWNLFVIDTAAQSVRIYPQGDTTWDLSMHTMGRRRK